MSKGLISIREGDRKFIKAWAWPSEVEEFLRERSIGFTIHVCNGSSHLGDLTIDKYMPADIIGDMYNLPLKTGIADTVICDPPWGMDYVYKPKLMTELRRILKFGGQLIFNAPWCPKCPGLALEEIWVPTWQLMTFTHITLIWVARKVKSQMFDISRVTKEFTECQETK